MTRVNLLTARAEQYAVLLGLSQSQAKTLADQGPFASIEALRTAVPGDIEVLSAEVQKPDINQSTQEQLVVSLGLSVDHAKLVLAGKPYFTIFEISQVEGLPPGIPPTLASAFTGPDLSFVDKSVGQTVAMTPQHDKLVVVAESEQESASLPSTFSDMGLHLFGSNSDQTVYSVYEVGDAENGVAAMRRAALSSGVNRTIPAMSDAEGAEIFIDPVLLLVQFKPTTTRASQERQLEELGLTLARRHRAPGLVTVRVDEAVHDPGRAFSCIAALNALDDVEFSEPVYISVDDQEGLAPVSNGASGGEQARWNQSLVGLKAAHDATRGSSDVVVAVIDSGVDDTHPFLQDSLIPRGQKDWNFEDPGERRPIDLTGHGTFVAGLVAGADSTGIAPECKVLPIRVPLRGGVAAYADRRSAILYALDQVQPDQRLILNLSWKTARDVASIRTALQTAAERGAIIVASAGNWPDRASQPHFPSDYPFVISVGAVTPEGTRAHYSFYGSNVDLAAPGGAGQGVEETDLKSFAVGNGYRTDFGTSFAAPHVAATVALMLSQDMSLGYDQVLERLSTTARQVSNGGLGAGLIDCAASLGQHVQTPEPPVTDGSFTDPLNTADHATLVEEFGLLPITARILIARRVIRSSDQLDGVLGLTDAQRNALRASIVGGSPPEDPGDYADTPTEPSDIEHALERANSASLEELSQVKGMPRFTARLILARRPLEVEEDLTDLLGMSAAVVDAMSSSFHPGWVDGS